MSQFIEMFGNPLSSIQKNELKKLGDCCQINPRRPSVSISDSDLVSFVPMPAVNEDGYIDGATNEEYGKVKKGFTYFENNDVLFAKITPCMENGKGAIAEALTNGIGMGSTEFHVLRPIDGISNPYWLLTLTRMPIFREYAAKNMSGTGGQRRVGAAFLENFMIGLPSISEQETFETIYRQADKSEFVGCKSQFIEMFGNQNTNDKGWTESLVKDEFKLSMGKTPARNNPECWDNGTHKWVSISDMSSYTRYTGDTSEYITDYAIADSGIKAVPKGTIIMSFKLSIGRTAITSEDLYTNEAIMAFAGFDEKKFNIDFLHFLIANKNWLLGAKQAVKGQTLNKESIGNAKIIIPPIEAQEEFASIYNQADKSEFELRKSIEAIDQVIKSLINN
jgi:type I restriction enzyme S subunit